jgi:uncharacterized BrkB/YihY/UPF0761 family membrane protein
LLIVIAVAGLAFGREAAQNAIIGQLSDLMGQQTAEVIQTAIASAASTQIFLLGAEFTKIFAEHHSRQQARSGIAMTEAVVGSPWREQPLTLAGALSIARRRQR